MRGAIKPLSRLNVTRTALAAMSVFATSCMLAMPALAKSQDAGQGPGTTTPPTQPSDGINGESVAYAVPRNAPSGTVEVILPRPLAPSDVAFYKRALQLQKDGQFAASDKMLDRASDSGLVGAVLALRYLSNNYITKPAELTAWWAKYSNQPEAPAIYALMQHKLPRANLPPAPHQALLPEETLTYSGAARPGYAPDSASWRKIFLSGLDAWKQHNLTQAADDFRKSSQLHGISADDRAASDFWAARAALRMQQPDQYLDWLHQASWASGTFYGMLASRLLGQNFMPTYSTTLTEADVTAVDSLPDGHLAFEMLQVGLTEQAETALRALWPQIRSTPDLGHAVMAVAARAGLVNITIAIAGTLPQSGNEFAGVHLPMPPLHPEGGFKINPALVYALTRTESGFDPHAVSYVGARGLMQLMPRTAEFMRQDAGISGSINNPSANLAMGQAYIQYLARQPDIDNNLMAILASYNAGPGAAATWYNAITKDSDPLMFIETIPNDQTRHFVHQVLADSWIYAEEIGVHPRSLDELAQGEFPTLQAFTPAPIETADAQ